MKEVLPPEIYNPLLNKSFASMPFFNQFYNCADTIDVGLSNFFDFINTNPTDVLIMNLVSREEIGKGNQLDIAFSISSGSEYFKVENKILVSYESLAAYQSEKAHYDAIKSQHAPTQSRYSYCGLNFIIDDFQTYLNQGIDLMKIHFARIHPIDGVANPYLTVNSGKLGNLVEFDQGANPIYYRDLSPICPIDCPY